MLGSTLPAVNRVSAAWNTVALFDEYEGARAC
jgi:hypothetical protein